MDVLQWNIPLWAAPGHILILSTCAYWGSQEEAWCAADKQIVDVGPDQPILRVLSMQYTPIERLSILVEFFSPKPGDPRTIRVKLEAASESDPDKQLCGKCSRALYP